jgi:hypothetical protein
MRSVRNFVDPPFVQGLRSGFLPIVCALHKIAQGRLVPAVVLPMTKIPRASRFVSLFNNMPV